jgi:hypothetical protein
MSNSLHCFPHLIGITEEFVTKWVHFVIQLIYKRDPGGDVQVDDLMIADLIKVLYQRPQAVAVCGDEYSFTLSNGRNNCIAPIWQETIDGVF